ncbi:hypothetical protein T08_3924 [Trichinella sp. T8]|nr:hypothetical protein T08_3924 [Trichinella sp. T8]
MRINVCHSRGSDHGARARMVLQWPQVVVVKKKGRGGHWISDIGYCVALQTTTADQIEWNNPTWSYPHYHLDQWHHCDLSLSNIAVVFCVIYHVGQPVSLKILSNISSPSSGCSVNAIFKGGKFAAKRCNSFWSVGQRRLGKTISFYEHA